MAAPRAVWSAPGLCAALCAWPALPLTSPPPALASSVLVPMYRIDGRSAAAEAAGAARVASEVVERLRRLPAAYGAWPVFEPGPYFDLQPAQAALLVQVSERVSTVHVVFMLDALLPAWQVTVAAAAKLSTIPRGAGSAAWQPVAAHWSAMQAVIESARQLLLDDIRFLATNAAVEERGRWQPYVRQPCSGRPCGGDLQAVRTLTLAIDFPLPAERQPHRLQRMRRAWEHRRRRGRR